MLIWIHRSVKPVGNSLVQEVIKHKVKIKYKPG